VGLASRLQAALRTLLGGAVAGRPGSSADALQGASIGPGAASNRAFCHQVRPRLSRRKRATDFFALTSRAIHTTSFSQVRFKLVSGVSSLPAVVRARIAGAEVGEGCSRADGFCGASSHDWLAVPWKNHFKPEFEHPILLPGWGRVSSFQLTPTVRCRPALLCCRTTPQSRDLLQPPAHWFDSTDSHTGVDSRRHWSPAPHSRVFPRPHSRSFQQGLANAAAAPPLPWCSISSPRSGHEVLDLDLRAPVMTRTAPLCRRVAAAAGLRNAKRSRQGSGVDTVDPFIQVTGREHQLAPTAAPRGAPVQCEHVPSV